MKLWSQLIDFSYLSTFYSMTPSNQSKNHLTLQSHADWNQGKKLMLPQDTFHKIKFAACLSDITCTYVLYPFYLYRKDDERIHSFTFRLKLLLKMLLQLSKLIKKWKVHQQPSPLNSSFELPGLAKGNIAYTIRRVWNRISPEAPKTHISIHFVPDWVKSFQINCKSKVGSC